MPALAGGGRVGGQCDGMHFTPPASLRSAPSPCGGGMACVAAQSKPRM
jgi:hypothetical protein